MIYRKTISEKCKTNNYYNRIMKYIYSNKTQIEKKGKKEMKVKVAFLVLSLHFLLSLFILKSTNAFEAPKFCKE